MSRRPLFYLLNRRAGWRLVPADPGVALGGDGAWRLRPLPGSVHPLVDAGGTLGGLIAPVAIALDYAGNVYLLDREPAIIRRFDLCARRFETLPCVGGSGAEPRHFSDPHGLAISARDDLYVADTGNRRIQVFALPSLALRAIWGPFVEAGRGVWTSCPIDWECLPDPWPKDVWEPVDVAIGPDGRVYVADRFHGLIHVLSACGQWQAAYSGASGTEPALQLPWRVALDRSGRIYVIEEGAPAVVVLDPNGAFIERLTTVDGLRGRLCPLAIAVDLEGNICLSDGASRTIQAFCPDDDGKLCPIGSWPGFAGTGLALAFDSHGAPLIVEAERKRVCQLEPETAFPIEGRLFSQALDSRRAQCVWHRLELEACLPPGGRITIETFTSESARSPEEIQSLPNTRWSLGGHHTTPGDADWDCLVQGPPGRFLWLRITLAGEGAATPVLSAARVYFPRASSRQYLPAVYQDDAESAAFLDRFLSVFDRIWLGFDRELSTFARYFDAGATPATEPDFLAWLASWIGLSLDRHWPEAKRRRLLREAHRLYRLRGTPAGLVAHVEIYTGIEPRLLEHFTLRRWYALGEGRLGDCTRLWGDSVVKRLQLGEYSRIGEFQLLDTGDPLRDPFFQNAHQFTLFVPLVHEPDDVTRQTLERVVALASPAHALGKIEYVRPRMRPGLQAFVGVDTVIGAWPRETVSDQSRLGVDTLLPGDPAAQGGLTVGSQARIGSSTHLS